MSWAGRLLGRLLGRNLGRSLLSLLLAALLAFAFGTLTVLRSIYSELYQHVEVKPKITGGIAYERAVHIASSDYVCNPYYETVIRGALGINANDDTSLLDLVFTNNVERWTQNSVDWLEGWDTESFLMTEQAVCVIPEVLAVANGLNLGDSVLVLEEGWYAHLMENIKTLEEEKKMNETRWERRPTATIAGIVPKASGDQVYIPVTAWRRFISILGAGMFLDMAEYTLVDYHQAEEFSRYVQDVMAKSANKLKFTMDTSYADRIYKIHQIIEALYPLTIVAAILLGGVLPGLIVLHASREISILRAMGVKVGQCVSVYTLVQMQCALLGLFLGFALVILIQKQMIRVVWSPFCIYLVAHLAACGSGSGVFAWFCARKSVLAQLQANE